jgi:diguanylate cyclase (GGDEF)-like protein/PAS domain S-box-containing protein
MNGIDAISLQTLLENAHIGVVIHRWDTSIVYANPTALKLLRLTHEQIIGRDLMDPQWRFIDDGNRVLHPNEFPVNKVKRFRSPVTNEVMGVLDSHRKKATWFLVNAYMDAANKLEDSFIIVTFNDITESKHIFSYENILQNSQDIVIVTEADDIDSPTGPKIIFVNAAFEKLTGYSAHEVIGETPRILQGKHTDLETLRRIRTALTEKKSIRENILNYSKTGHPYWLDMNIFPLTNRYGEITHFAAIERDITEQMYHADQLEKRNKDLKLLKDNLEQLVSQRTEELHTANQQLERLAFNDSLTNLPNRRSFNDHAAKQIFRAQRNQFFLLTGILDLDNFKTINDTYGHSAGDQVLISCAESIMQFFRQEDIYGRIGGEEFAFSIIIGNAADAQPICDRLLTCLREQTINIDTQLSISITASIGYSLATPDSDICFEDEMKRADLALYQAKNAGRDQAVMFFITE